MRVLHLRPRFRVDQAALAPRGTATRRAVALALRRLMDERVAAPGPDDIAVDLPPSVVGRRVEDTELVIAYMPIGGEIVVLALRKQTLA